MCIEVPVKPTGQMRHRHGRRGGYKDPKQTTRENTIKTYLSPHAPCVPHTGMIGIDITAYYPMPKQKPAFLKGIKAPKWADLCERGIIRPCVTPDIDNLAKQILDCMNGWFFKDDRQVVRLTVNKYYGYIPKWVIKITGESIVDKIKAFLSGLGRKVDYAV